MSELAQFNIARLAYDWENPAVDDFRAGLDKINRLAEDTPGFVWRMDGPTANARAGEVYDSSRIAVTLSVWEDIDVLREFVYQSEHFDYLRRRKEWFGQWDGPSLVLWWIPEGQRPTIRQAQQKLTLLAEIGPSRDAFTFAHPHPTR